MRTWFATLAVLALTLSGCARPAPEKAPGSNVAQSAPAEAASTAGVDETLLVSREALFGQPQRTDAQISPGGDMISFLAPENGALNVFIVPAGQPLARARAITRVSGRGVSSYFWAEDNRHVLFLQDESGDERWRLHSVDVTTGGVRDLTPIEGVSARFIGKSRSEPEWVLVGLNDRSPDWHDVYRINVRTGQRALVQRNTEKFSEFVSDHENFVRLAIKRTPEGGAQIFAFLLKGGWKLLMEAPIEDSMTTRPIAFLADGRRFLMFDSTGRDKAALAVVDTISGDRKVIGESPRADVSAVWINAASRDPEAFAADYLKPEWAGLTEEARADIAALADGPGDPEVVSRTADNRRWIVRRQGPTAPPSYWLFDRTNRKSVKLFDEQPALATAPLEPMAPVEIPASDGLMLVAYLTLPPGSDLDGNGVPSAPAPLVLLVHEGPWRRDTFGFDPEHQWLANRGYAVLSVNFRGSTGFGKAFVNRGDREWGGAILRDLVDAANWAVARGVSRPEQVAVMGAQFGGYATLAALAFAPDQFACGVARGAAPDLESMIANGPPGQAARLPDLQARVGDPRKAEGLALLRAHSPLTAVARMSRPLLLVQGGKDPNIRSADSARLIAALEQRGAPATYVVYPDEGATFARPQNRASFYAVTEGFLQQCLGGRAQPIGRDFVGTSLEVEAGAPRIAGLAEALSRLPTTTGVGR